MQKVRLADTQVARIGLGANRLADRKRSVLEVHAIHEDVRFTRGITEVHAELEALASWLELEAVALPRK
jgi:uncharacterized protein YcaQ